MSTNSMLFGKLARGETLNPAEALQIERAITEYDQLKAFNDGMTNGSQNVSVSEIKAKTGRFDIAPLGLIYTYFATNHSCAHGATKYIDWDGVICNAGHFIWNQSEPSILRLKSAGEAYLLCGHIANQSGGNYWRVDLEWFGEDGTSIGLQAVTASSDYIVSFAIPIQPKLNSGIRFYKLGVHNETGSPITVPFGRMSLINIY